MFRLLQTTSWKLQGKAFNFFDKIFQQLPAEFEFLLEGLNQGLYREYTVNYVINGHFYTVGFDPAQSDKSMIKGKKFELKNIIIKQNQKTEIDSLLN